MQNDIEKAAEIILSGGLILYPTDTIWGIGCDALNAGAVKKVYQLKKRPDSKSLIIMLANIADLAQYVADPPPQIESLLKTFVRPTTIIYPKAVGLPASLINEDGSIAIRITKDEFCKQLINKIGHPLVSTSANISGAPSAPTFSFVSQTIRQGVDYIVKYRQDDEGEKPASRIIKFDEQGNQITIRE